MKRIIFGLFMLSSLALAAAPAHATVNLECGNKYAIEIHGTEPELTADQPLAYIAGVGTIQFGARNTLTNSCAVTGGELIYNDNDVLTYSAGPAACYAAASVLGGGIPCFDGTDHVMSGTLSPSVNGNGSATLSVIFTEGWVNGTPAATDLPLTFNLQQNAGAVTVLGNSAADPGPNPTAPPPGSPVLTITMQKQSTLVTLPVTGPGNQTGVLPYSPPSPLGCTNSDAVHCNGYGVAPYTGTSISLFQGYGAPSADLFAQPIQGSFGTSLSALSVFANGQSGGSVTFNSNDNVGNTTGATNDDCDTETTQTGNFADGASNIGAALLHPSAHCLDAVGLATFELGSVVWGATDTSNFTIVTGLGSGTLTGGELIPAGLMSDATGLSSGIAGGLTPIVLTSITSVNHPATGTIKFINSSAAGCDVTASLAANSATSSNTMWTCNLSALSATFTVEGDTGLTLYASNNCSCSGTGSPAGAGAASTTSTLTMTSTNCPLTYSQTITCKN